MTTATPWRPLTVSLILLVLCSNPASARAIRIDTVLGFCDVNAAAGQAVDVAYIPLMDPFVNTQADCTDPDFVQPFSLRIGTSLFDRLYLTNDGIITFEAPYSGSATPLMDPSLGPVIAPFFTGTPFTDAGFAEIGYGGNQSTPDMLSINYLGGNAGDWYQVNFIDRSSLTGLIGDFDLELNYGAPGHGIVMDQGGALVGLNTGAGQRYVAPGSGVAGAFTGGFGDCGSALISPLALACIDNGTGIGGLTFEFRGGTIANLPPAGVPAPASAWLLLIGLLAARFARQQSPC